MSRGRQGIVYLRPASREGPWARIQLMHIAHSVAKPNNTGVTYCNTVDTLAARLYGHRRSWMPIAATQGYLLIVRIAIGKLATYHPSKVTSGVSVYWMRESSARRHRAMCMSRRVWLLYSRFSVPLKA